MVNLLCFLHLHKGWKLFPPSIFSQPKELLWQLHFDLCHLSHEKDGSIVYWVHGDCMIIACMVFAWWLHGVCIMIAWWLHGVCMIIAWWLHDDCMVAEGCVDRYVHGEPSDYLMNLLTPNKAAEPHSNWCSKFQEQSSCVNPSSTGCSTEWNFKLSTEYIVGTLRILLH